MTLYRIFRRLVYWENAYYNIFNIILYEKKEKNAHEIWQPEKLESLPI